MFEHDLANASSDAGLRGFVGAVSLAASRLQRAALPRAPANLPPSVTLTVTNYAYVDGFENFRVAARASLTTPAVAAMDTKSYAWFTSRGEHALLITDAKSLPFSRRSLYIKSEISARLLDAGLKLIFSEMDVFWCARARDRRRDSRRAS